MPLQMAQAGERAKVYRLNDEGKWEDKGTGNVSVEYLERSEALGLVVLDKEDNSTLLVHRISADDVYRRQEDTIISWTDPEVATDLALSFHEGMGCAYIWDQICSVQRSIPSVGGINGGSRAGYGDFEHSGTSQDDGAGGDILELSPVELSNLPQIVKVIAEVVPFERDRIASLIVHERTYIQKLLELFRICEDLENMEGLHMLYKIVKGLILLNDSLIFDIIFSDEYIMDIVGALEYDPELQTCQEHRSFLKNVVVHKQAVPIHDPVILSKIHQTYQIGYIKDVILPRVLDDQTFSTLNSMILFNNVEVVTSLHANEAFLGKLFAKLRSPDTSVEVWKDLILFIQDFVSLSKHLQPPVRSMFFSSLVQKGLFEIVANALESSDEATSLSGSDILIVILSHEPILLRVFLVQQPDHHLFSLLVKGMLTNGEGGLQAQLLEVMRMLLDSDTMELQHSEKSTFLDVFYEKYMDQLVEALTAGCSFQGTTDGSRKLPTSFGVAGKMGPVSPEILGNICDLLCFCVQHHVFKIKYYVMRNNVVEKILRLTHRKEKYLVVGAVRFVRACVGLKEEFYSRHLIKNNLFEPVIQAFLANGRRYNLLNSAVLELLDFMRKENMKTLIAHIVETFGDKLEKTIDYVDTYQALKLKYEQSMEGSRWASQATGSGVDSVHGRNQMNSNPELEARMRKDERALDKDEEDYFNEDSDDEEHGVSVKSATPSAPLQAVVVNASALADVLFREGSFGLVDYDDEDEDLPLLANNHLRKGSSAKKTEDRVQLPIITGSPRSQEEGQSPKRRALQDVAGSPKKHKAELGEAEVSGSDDHLLELVSTRDPENYLFEDWRKTKPANEGMEAVSSLPVSSGRCGDEDASGGESPSDRNNVANGGDPSTQSKCSRGSGSVDESSMEHFAAAPDEGMILREGESVFLREGPQTSPG